MFKGTNKVWKGLALALALCMLPTVALATSVNTVSVALETASSEDAVKVTVTIGDATKALADTDVTILALRKATNFEGTPALNTPGDAVTSNIPTVAADLKKQVTYIDQETSGEDGKVTFEFIPASTDAEYSSKYIDIYVGGADVAAPQVLTVERALAAPTLTLKSSTWMAGDDVVLTLGGSVASDATALAAWAADVTAKFTVSAGEAIADATGVETWAIENGELTIPYSVIAGRTITGITFESGSYATKTVEGITALKETLKTAGTLGSIDILDTDPVELTITGEEWAAALGSALEGAADVNAIVAVEGGTLTGASVVGDKLVLEGLTAGAEGTKTYKVTAAVPFYTVSAQATVVISTAAYKDAAALATSYAPKYAEPILSGEEGNLAGDTPTEEEIKMYGTATVTFPAVGTNGTAITWEATGDNAADVEGTSPTFTLPRLASTDASGAKNTVYTFAAMVGDIAVENITVTVSKCGTALSIEEANVAILKADAYGMTGKTLISVVGPEDFSGSMSIGGVKLFYSPSKAKYYGVVDSALAGNAAAVVSNVEFDEATPSEILYFGVAVAEEGKTALNGRDFLLSVRLTKDKLNDTDVVTDKTYIALDVATSEPDGEFIGGDFLAMVRGTKGTQLPVLTVAE